MISQLSVAIIIFQIFHTASGSSWGNNPFAGGYPTGNCFLERNISGCNGSKGSFHKACVNESCCEPTKLYTEPDTYFFLFTCKNTNEAEFLHKCGTNLPSTTNFNPLCKIVILVHGYFLGSCDMACIREIKDQLLYKHCVNITCKYGMPGNCTKKCIIDETANCVNIIIVDWTWGNRPDLKQAMDHGQNVVAPHIACLLKNIVNQTNASASNIHCVGHSLGAHVCGNAAKIFNETTGMKFGKISGLDPANVLKGSNTELSPTDAECVLSWHTNGGDCLPYFGNIQPSGTEDYYFNGGSKQLSCFLYAIESLFKFDIFYGFGSLISLSICSHLHCYQYFKWSINLCKHLIMAVKCNSIKDCKEGKCRYCNADGSNCKAIGYDTKCNPETKNSTNIYCVQTPLICDYSDPDHMEFQGASMIYQNAENETKCFDPNCYCTE